MALLVLNRMGQAWGRPEGRGNGDIKNGQRERKLGPNKEESLAGTEDVGGCWGKAAPGSAWTSRKILAFTGRDGEAS